MKQCQQGLISIRIRQQPNVFPRIREARDIHDLRFRLDHGCGKVWVLQKEFWIRHKPIHSATTATDQQFAANIWITRPDIEAHAVKDLTMLFQMDKRATTTHWTRMRRGSEKLSHDTFVHRNLNRSPIRIQLDFIGVFFVSRAQNAPQFQTSRRCISIY